MRHLQQNTTLGRIFRGNISKSQTDSPAFLHHGIRKSYFEEGTGSEKSHKGKQRHCPLHWYVSNWKISNNWNKLNAEEGCSVLRIILSLFLGYGKNGDLTVPFWSTKDAGQTPFTFKIGMGQVIKGWDEGVAGMDLGEIARVR